MKRLLYLTLLLVGTVLYGDELIKGPERVDSGRSVVLVVPADRAGEKFEWKVEGSAAYITSDDANSRRLALLDLESEVVVAFISWDKQAFDLHRIQVGKKKPDPDPIPDDDDKPSPKAKTLFVTIWENPKNRTPQQAEVLTDTALFRWFGDRQHKLRILDVNLNADEANNFRPFLDKVSSLPTLVIQNKETGEVLSAEPMPGSTKEIIDRSKLFLGE